MDINDMELLELAAKAAGYHPVRFADNGIDLLLEGVQEPWNPRDDDGDALRLAVKLWLTISCERHYGADYMIATPPHSIHGCNCMVDQCPYAATRLAITRAAAAIGASMP